MNSKSEVRIVSGTDNPHDVFQNEMDLLGDSFPLANPYLSRSVTLSHAIEQFEKKQPSLLVLNPSTPAGDNAAIDTNSFLEKIQGIPILVALVEPDRDWARQVILRPNLSVWNWETTESAGLEDVLPPLLHPANRRELQAIIRLRQPDPLCDICANDTVLFRDLPLKTDAAYRDAWLDNLQPLFKLADRTASWQSVADNGNKLFRSMLNDLGDAFIEAVGNGTALSLRFEIAKDDLRTQFSLPLELLNRGARWQDFFCRLTPMARRVRVQKRQRDPAQRPPLLLRVDTAAARGSLPVVEADGKVVTKSFVDLSFSVSTERTMLHDLDTNGSIRLESLDSENMIDALSARLNAKERPEIIHFTGHAMTNRAGSTDLIFPSAQSGNVARLSIDVFAKWLPDTVRLVVLSACQGISSHTALALHAAKGVAVLGFRYEVEPVAAAAFLQAFYRAHLHRGLSLSASYQEACLMGNDAQYAWATAVLLDHD